MSKTIEDFGAGTAHPEADHARTAALLLGDARNLLDDAQVLLHGAQVLVALTPAPVTTGTRPAKANVEKADGGRSAVAGLRRGNFGVRSISAVAAGGIGITVIAVSAVSLMAGNHHRPTTRPISAAAHPTPTNPRPPGPAQAATSTTVPVPAPEIPQSVTVSRLASTATVAGPVVVQTSGPEQGLLTAPDDYHQLGWYRHDPSGLLVIDGHVGFRANPGPLAYIGELVTGDTLTVTFPSGVRTYQVTTVARAAKSLLPPDYFSAQYDGQVMLITCDYTSAFNDGHYADNVYVVAAPQT